MSKEPLDKDKLLDALEESWSIERGQKMPVTIESMDPEFKVPELQWDLLNGVVKRKYFLTWLDETIAGVPAPTYTVIGILWLATVYPVFRFLMPRAVESLFKVAPMNEALWMVMLFGFALFTTLVISFFVLSIPYYIKLLPSFKEKRISVHFRWGMAVATVMIVFVATITFNQLSIGFVKTESGYAFIDKHAVKTAIDSATVHETVCQTDLEKTSKAELNGMGVWAMKNNDRMRATEIFALGEKYYASEDSRAFEYNTKKFGIATKPPHKYSVHNDSVYQRISEVVDSSATLTRELIGENPTPQQISALAVALVREGYPGRAKEVYRDYYASRIVDRLIEINYAKFVVDNHQPTTGVRYDSIEVNGKEIRLVDPGSYAIADPMIDEKYEKFVHVLLTEQDGELLNAIGVKNEEKGEVTRSMIAYYLAGQKDPFSNISSAGFNYKKRVVRALSMAEKETMERVQLGKTGFRFIESDCNEKWTSSGLYAVRMNCLAVKAETDKDYVSAFTMYDEAIANNEAPAQWNMIQYLKLANLKKLHEASTTVEDKSVKKDHEVKVKE